MVCLDVVMEVLAPSAIALSATSRGMRKALAVNAKAAVERKVDKRMMKKGLIGFR